LCAYQSENGWYGGRENDAEGERDQYWPAWDVLYALMQFAEAEPSHAPRIQASLLRYAAEVRLHPAACASVEGGLSFVCKC
jgi:hypothetical protein